MEPSKQEHSDYRFLIGLVAGTMVGAGLTLWLAPRVASELRERLATSATGLAKRASAVRDQVADAVARGAHEVELQANATKSDGAATDPKHSMARSASGARSL